MKTIEMKKTVCGSDGWKEYGPVTFTRVSRWITVQQNYNPIYVEFDECCERVRVYELVKVGV